MIHWRLPDRPVEHDAAAAVSGWSGAGGRVSSDEPALLDAVIAVAEDLSGQADPAVDQVVRRVRAA